MRTSERQIQLDAVRGVAILLAMGWHLNPLCTNWVAFVLLYPGRSFGWAGVDLFFVLSGFLVGGLVLREVNRTGQFRAKRFFIRRAMRLWPVLYLFLIAHLIQGKEPRFSYFPQIFFHVQNYFRTPISHLWSLAVEEHFYLLMGLSTPFFARRSVKPRHLVYGLLGIIAASTAIRTIAALAGVDPVSLQWQTQYRVDVLALGVLLAVVDVHYPRFFIALKRLWLLWLSVMAVGCAVLVYVRADIGHREALIGFPAAAITSAAFILLVHRRPISTTLRPLVKVVGWLGIYSYSIYIWHVGVGRAGGRLFARLIGQDTPEVRVVFAYASAIIVAFAVTKAVERPGLALRDRLFPSAHAETKSEREVDEQEGAARATV